MVASATPAWVGLGEACEAGRASTRALLVGCGAVRAGATTLEVARAAEEELARLGAIGVRGVPHGRGGPRFPEACIVCVHDVAADGVPGDRVLRPGEVVTIDAPACVRTRGGFAWADAAVSLIVPPERAFGEIDDRTRTAMRLPVAAREIVRSIVGRMGDGKRWIDAAGAGRARALELGVALVEGLDGHGVGRAMHQPPRLALTDGPGRITRDIVLEEGMTLAVEAVAAEALAGAESAVATRTDADGWSERTANGARAAGWEVTVRVERWGARLVAGWLGGGSADDGEVIG